MTQINEGLNIFHALSDLARRYQFRNRDEVCCYGLTVSQCYALQLLFHHGTMPSSDLALRLGLDLSSTTRLVDQLIRKKLAMRRKGSADARVREVQISDQGQKLIGRIEDDFANLLEQAIAGFPPVVRQNLPEVLRCLTKALETGECGPKQVIPAASIRKST